MKQTRKVVSVHLCALFLLNFLLVMIKMLVSRFPLPNIHCELIVRLQYMAYIKQRHARENPIPAKY